MTRAFADAWTAQGPGCTVTHRDLHRDPVPHLPDASLHWAPRLRSSSDSPSAAAEDLQQALVAELLAADVLLVGAPMYNYSLPSSLKAWIDHVHVLGVTASFDAPAQPMAGRRAVVALSQGMAYEDGMPTAGQDHAAPVLDLVLGRALGMTLDVLVARYAIADRIPDMRELAEQGKAAFEQVLQEAAALGARLATERPPLPEG